MDAGESIQEAAIRELEEECGLLATEVKKLGYMKYRIANIKEVMHCHIFETWSFEGVSSETEEMRPVWFLESEIPYSAMWPDDKWWFPYMLSSKSFTGRCEFADLDTIAFQEIKEQ